MSVLVKIFIPFLIFMCFKLCECGNSANVNGMVDPLIADLIKDLKSKKETSINIPAITYTFPGKTKAGLKAVGGVFSDLSTLHRDGDATLEIVGASSILKGGLSLSRANLNIRRAFAWYGSMSISDNLSISVQKIAIGFQITITFSGTGCKATVDSLELRKFGPVKVDVKDVGAGINNMINGYVNNKTGQLRSEMETKVKTSLQNVIGKRNMCAGLIGK